MLDCTYVDAAAQTDTRLAADRHNYSKDVNRLLRIRAFSHVILFDKVFYLLRQFRTGLPVAPASVNLSASIVHKRTFEQNITSAFF